MSIYMPVKHHHGGTRSPEYALLGFLYDQPNHGYILQKQLVTELGHVWHVSQSQTYAILKRLVNQGDISSSTLEQKKLPARQLLEISAKGRRRFKDWLETPSGGSVRSIRLEFITRLYFAQRLYPDRIQNMIEDETADINAAILRLETARDAIPPEQPFNRLSLDLRIRQLHSVRDWLGECRKTLKIKVKRGTA
jgi:PadR family transcriptional regulator, regulatory protein AphA